MRNFILIAALFCLISGCTKAYHQFKEDEVFTYSLGTGKGIKFHVNWVKISDSNLEAQVSFYNYYDHPVVVHIDGILCEIGGRQVAALVKSRLTPAEYLIQLGPMNIVKDNVVFSFDKVPPGVIKIIISKIYKGTIINYQMNPERLQEVSVTLPKTVNP